MIKLTRLPNPSEALFLHTYKVSGTVTYFELAAFEKGIQNCFGFDSSEAESFRNIEITDASPTDLTDDDIRALQAERDDLKSKYRNLVTHAGAANEQVEVLESKLSEMTGCRNAAVNEKNELQRRHEILETAANATTLEVNRLLESNKHAWEAAGLERQACINANQEWAAEQRKHAETQKELDRVTGALHLEQKSHDETKQTLGRSAMKFGDLILAVREYADKHAKFGTAEDLVEILRTTVLDNE
jgi:hypothetical protein